MRYVLTGVAAIAALGLVTFTPNAAEARDRGVGIYAPGIGVEIGPRYRYDRRYYRDRHYSWRDDRDWRDRRDWRERRDWRYGERRWDRRYYR